MIDPHRNTTEHPIEQPQSQLRVIANRATVIAQDQTTYVGGPHLTKTSFVKAVYDATGQAVNPELVSVDLSNVDWNKPADYRVYLQYTNPGKTATATAHLHVFELAGHDVTIHAGEELPAATDFVTRLIDPGQLNALQQVSMTFDEVAGDLVAGQSYGVMLTYAANGVTAGAHQVLHVLENLVSLITANQTTYVNGPQTNPDRFIKSLKNADGQDIDVEKAIVDMSAVDWTRAGRYPVPVRYTDHGKNVCEIAYENVFMLTAHNQIIVAGDGEPIPARYVALARDQFGRDRTRWTAMSYDDPTANHTIPGTYDVTLKFEVNGSVATLHPTLQVLPEMLRPSGSAADMTINVHSQSGWQSDSEASRGNMRHGLRHSTGSRVANNAAKTEHKRTWWQRLFGLH